MKLHYYGHSCFLLETAGKKILFDPFITPNELAAHIDIETIECDYILVSHGHGDHVADLIAIAKRTGAKVVSVFELVNWCAAQDVDNGHPMNIGGAWNFDFGRVKMVNAVHSNSFPDGSYAGAPGGFVISNDEGCLYYAGDTALTPDMRLLAQQYKIDFAMMPIGGNFTMDSVDALEAANFVNCDTIVGMHYDTFPWIEIDREKAIALFENARKRLILMDIGGATLELRK